jgi:hypothetical protein
VQQQNPEVTPWFPVAQHPERPGYYEVRAKGARKTERVHFNGKEWEASPPLMEFGEREWRGMAPELEAAH